MEYKYHLTSRTVVPSVLPSGGLISAELHFDHPGNDNRWGTAIYSRPLTEEEITEYRLVPDPVQLAPKRPKGIIVCNRAKCLVCGDIIESHSTHDYVTCSCGNLSVDGGHSYLKRSAQDLSKYEDLSEIIFPDAE